MEVKAKGLFSDISRNVHRLGGTAEEFSPDHNEENSSNVQISPSTIEDILGGLHFIQQQLSACFHWRILTKVLIYSRKLRPRQRRRIIAFTVMALIVVFVMDLVFNVSGWIRLVEPFKKSDNDKQTGTKMEMEIKKKYYLIVSQMKLGMVMNVDKSQKKPGARVFPAEKNWNENQQWYDDPQTKLIRSKLNDFCLDVEDDRIGLVLNPCEPGKQSQQWVRRGHLIAIGMGSRVLEISEGKENAGAKICSYPENSREHQKWTFQMV